MMSPKVQTTSGYDCFAVQPPFTPASNSFRVPNS